MSKGKEEIVAPVTSGQSPPHAISTPIINLLFSLVGANGRTEKIWVERAVRESEREERRVGEKNQKRVPG
jgi:hypothetical protein